MIWVVTGYCRPSVCPLGLVCVLCCLSACRGASLSVGVEPVSLSVWVVKLCRELCSGAGGRLCHGGRGRVPYGGSACSRECLCATG